uniref:Uncharacterized protein n=1 Tax=Octopus bimaculoides TaxID=37653 RepID=A0A0L8HPM9_OCTBM
MFMVCSVINAFARMNDCVFDLDASYIIIGKLITFAVWFQSKSKLERTTRTSNMSLSMILRLI